MVAGSEQRKRDWQIIARVAGWQVRGRKVDRYPPIWDCEAAIEQGGAYPLTNGFPSGFRHTNQLYLWKPSTNICLDAEIRRVEAKRCR